MRPSRLGAPEMTRRGSDDGPRCPAWGVVHALLLIPVTLIFTSIGLLTLMIPAPVSEYLVGHDLFVRLARAAFITACSACSLLTFLRGSHRTGVAISALFLLVIATNLSILIAGGG